VRKKREGERGRREERREGKRGEMKEWKGEEGIVHQSDGG
jgi:hypothetical protein